GADLIEEARLGAFLTAPLGGDGGTREAQVLQRVVTHITGDEALVVGELFGTEQTVREALYIVGVVSGDSTQRGLVSAEEFRAGCAFAQERLQLQRKRPCVEQAHERCELRLGGTGRLDHSNLPAQRVLDDGRIGLARQDAVSAACTRLEEVR